MLKLLTLNFVLLFKIIYKDIILIIIKYFYL